MVSTSPSESITTPLPSRWGPSVRSERAFDTALLLTFTTDRDSTVSCGSAPAAGGAAAPWARASSGAHARVAASERKKTRGRKPRDAKRMNELESTEQDPGGFDG